jgi:hypothetical protein
MYISDSLLELVTVIGSDLFDLDDDIKQYLQDPDLPLIFKIKIGLRYYVTVDMILQLQILKDHLGIPSFKDFQAKFVPGRQSLSHYHQE